LKAVLPEYYVLLCAGRYAATVKKLALAVTEDERQQLRKSLRYILESGLKPNRSAKGGRAVIPLIFAVLPEQARSKSAAIDP
jgi:hypothetical protein